MSKTTKNRLFWTVNNVDFFVLKTDLSNMYVQSRDKGFGRPEVSLVVCCQQIFERRWPPRSRANSFEVASAAYFVWMLFVCNFVRGLRTFIAADVSI